MAVSPQPSPTAFILIETDGSGREVARPTALCRGPWDEHSCHAGPPTALVARAVERLLPNHRLVRLTMEITRPIPMAGFTVEAEVTRAGRLAATAHAAILDLDGKRVATATTAHLASQPEDADMPQLRSVAGTFDSAVPGPFPLSQTRHGLTCFPDGVEVRYPPGQNGGPGPTQLWMKTVPIVDGEIPSAFEAICPFADCGNAISRNAEPDQYGFLNTDLTIYMHRPARGEWFGSDVVSYWNSDGIGMSDAQLLDVSGVVGRAVQSLVVAKA